MPCTVCRSTVTYTTQGSLPVICGGLTTRLEERRWEFVSHWHPGRPSDLGHPHAVHAALSTVSPKPAPRSSAAAPEAALPAAARLQAAAPANVSAGDVAKLYQQK